MSPRGRRSISMSKWSPTLRNGVLSGAEVSMPDPSMSTWPCGLDTMAKIFSAGALIRRVAEARSDMGRQCIGRGRRGCPADLEQGREADEVQQRELGWGRRLR